MNFKESKLRRSFLEKQMRILNCDIDGILRHHTDLLSRSLRNQALLMYYQAYGRYFRLDEPEEGP